MNCDAATVLIVEDDEDLREDLAFVLERRGYRVASAAHGAEALERLEELDTPCLVLLDLMMPIMDGWALRSELLADPGRSSIPIVLLSARDDVAEEAERLQAVDYVGKPVDLAKLNSLVDAYC